MNNLGNSYSYKPFLGPNCFKLRKLLTCYLPV